MNETPDTPDENEDTSGIEIEIATLATLISDARELVADGNTIELGALSDKIGVFCAAIAENPPAEAEGLATLIEALVADLNALGEDIAEQHKMLTQAAEKDGGGS